VRTNFIRLFCERHTTNAGATRRPRLDLDNDFTA
jgi:hypothetical protein